LTHRRPSWVGHPRDPAQQEAGLENGRDSPKQIAVRCGFANADTLRRSFVRHVGVTPAEYRKRYEQT